VTPTKRKRNPQRRMKAATVKAARTPVAAPSQRPA